MQPTSYPDVNELLDYLLAQMQRILGSKLVGLYLYGSLVSGGFDAVSDVDLLAAIASPLDEQEFGDLETMHRAYVANHPQWIERIEIGYLPVSGLKHFRTQSTPIAIISPGEPFHYRDSGKDWLMNWYLVREQGNFGPSPRALIDPIAQEEFFHAVRDHASGWSEWVYDMQDQKGQAYAILTLCRAIYAVTHGEQPSKQKAAQWVETTYPQWSPLIQRALQWRVAPLDEKADHAATHPESVRFVQFAIAQIVAS